jgi:hypothetical protein
LFRDFLSDKRLSLAVTEIAGRRANELGDLVAVLKLRRVSLHHGTHVAEIEGLLSSPALLFRRQFTPYRPLGKLKNMSSRRGVPERRIRART